MSTPNKKPVPLYEARIRPKCPFCGHSSYSSAGIHPQCAMHAEDKIRTEQYKRQFLQPSSTSLH